MRAAALLFLAAVSWPGAAAAQDTVRVWTTLSARAVPAGETTVLELHIETDGAAPERIAAPTLPPGIDVVGTRDYSQIRFSFPGGRSRLIRREMILRPTAPGRYRIPPFTIIVDGKTYRTAALLLAVTQPAAGQGGAIVPGGGRGGISAGAPPPAGSATLRAPEGALARGPGDEVLFGAWLRPDTVYVGEQLTLTAEVLVSERAQMRLRRAPEYQAPDAPGFWVHELPASGRAEPRIVGQQTYLGRTLSRAYFPLSPGVYTLEPARLVYEIRRGVLFAPQAQELASDSLPVVVLPLPEAGRPATFTGAVGRFSLRARVEPAEVPAGEATALTVEVEGDGNIKALPPPALPELDGFEVFPPTEEADVRADNGTVGGTKRFTWVLVPERAGRFELPPIEYAYFDPARDSYAVARAPLPVLTVRAGAVETPTPEAAIRYLKPAPAGPSPLRWVRTRWYAAAQLLPLIAVLAMLVGRRRIRRAPAPSRRALRHRLRAEMDALRKHAGGDAGTLLRGLDELVRAWLAERIGDPALRRAGPDAVRAALDAAGVRPETAGAAAALLERIARARFEPVPPGSAARLALIDEAERVLLLVDQEAHPPRRPAAAVLGLVLLIAAVPATARAQDPDAFERGAAAYQAGRHEEAAEAFAAFVAEHPSDPAGWYNLANAYHEAGERGRAVWAWLHAARLAPRDADTRHNLGVAGVDPWLRRVATPTVPLSTEETLLLAGAAWFVGAGAGILFLLRRRRASGAVAIIGIGIAVALLGAWTADRLAGATGVTFPAETRLRAAPHLHAEPLRSLEAGTGVRLLERRDGWLRVRTADGGEGWIEAGDIGTL
ncbi:MAG TPA: BatD family protein [Longimicrobiales bacterium]